MVNRENEAGAEVSYSASAAAIFIGWVSVMTLPSMSPEAKKPTAPMSVATRPSRSEENMTSLLRRRDRCQAETATMSRPPVTQQPKIVCGKVHLSTSLVRTAVKLSSSARPASAL